MICRKSTKKKHNADHIIIFFLMDSHKESLYSLIRLPHRLDKRKKISIFVSTTDIL